MFDFSQKEKELLEKIGATGNGREFISLLKKMKNDIDKTSNIKEGADYAAEVKGRAITTKIINKLLDGMIKTPGKNFSDSEDLDDWS